MTPDERSLTAGGRAAGRADGTHCARSPPGSGRPEQAGPEAGTLAEAAGVDPAKLLTVIAAAGVR
jgi:hypothetical protein